MKHWAIAGAMTLIVVAMVGCKRDAPDEPADYDREIDGPPSAIQAPAPNYDLIDDPVKVAERAKAARGARPPARPTTKPPDVPEVKKAPPAKSQPTPATKPAAPKAKPAAAKGSPGGGEAPKPAKDETSEG